MIESSFETWHPPVELMPSPEAAQLAKNWFEDCVAQLDEVGYVPRPRNGRLEYYVPNHYLIEEDDTEGFEAEYARRKAEGYLGAVTINVEPSTGKVTSVNMSGEFPAQPMPSNKIGCDVSADAWNARFFFPARHTPDEHQKAVLDTWIMPKTEVTKRMIALNEDYSEDAWSDYDAFYRAFYHEVDPATQLPAYAIDITHSVYGREERIEAKEQDRLGNLLELTANAVRQVGPWQAMVDNEHAA